MTETDFIPETHKNDYLASVEDISEKAYRIKPKEKEVTTFTNKDSIGTDYNYKHKIVWKNAIGFLILHILAAYGFFLLIIGTLKFYTIAWGKWKPIFAAYSKFDWTFFSDSPYQSNLPNIMFS